MPWRRSICSLTHTSVKIYGFWCTLKTLEYTKNIRGGGSVRPGIQSACPRGYGSGVCLVKDGVFALWCVVVVSGPVLPASRCGSVSLTCALTALTTLINSFLFGRLFVLVGVWVGGGGDGRWLANTATLRSSTMSFRTPTTTTSPWVRIKICSVSVGGHLNVLCLFVCWRRKPLGRALDARS